MKGIISLEPGRKLLKQPVWRMGDFLLRRMVV